MKKYLVAYTWSAPWGNGPGRSFGTTNGPVSEKVILEWEAAVKDANGFDNVAINNFQPLADD